VYRGRSIVISKTVRLGGRFSHVRTNRRRGERTIAHRISAPINRWTDWVLAPAAVQRIRSMATPTAQRERSETLDYEITSFARSSSDCGMVMPSALAVLRLITSSNLVGCSIGRSAGFAPLRILSTYTAARPTKSAMFTA
jgi:hypothetical protein